MLKYIIAGVLGLAGLGLILWKGVNAPTGQMGFGLLMMAPLVVEAAKWDEKKKKDKDKPNGS